MPEDEIDRIVDRIANRIRNNPREPLSDHQLAHLLSFNAKHARFFEAKLMQWAAARLEALHAVLTAEPADEDEALRIAWLKKSWDAKGRPRATIGSGGARGGTGRGGGGSSSGSGMIGSRGCSEGCGSAGAGSSGCIPR